MKTKIEYAVEWLQAGIPVRGITYPTSKKARASALWKCTILFNRRIVEIKTVERIVR